MNSTSDFVPPVSNKLRNEQQIFEDLSILCTSPGYVHAVALLCFNDNIVKYANEMTPEDMMKMFSTDRLIRTELATIQGLLIKGKIDYSPPEPAVIQGYIDRTYALLKELHESMSQNVFGTLDPQKLVDGKWDPFQRGEALREPIFYSGESAYSFQFRELSIRKYRDDNAWFEQNKGFTIDVARDVIHAVQKFQNEHLMEVARSLLHLPSDGWTLLPGFTFTAQEIANVSGKDEAVVELN